MTPNPTFWLMAEKALKFFAFAFVELMVLFIGISFLVALLQHYLSADRVQSLLSARHGRGYLVGAGMGALTPFCSCSTIPIAVGLLKARAGFGPTMTFLLTSPLVNPILIGLFLVTFGWRVTVIYAAMGLGLATMAGFLLDRLKYRRFIRKDAMHDSNNRAESNPKSPSDKQPAQVQSTIMEAMPATAATGPSGCCSSSATVSRSGIWRDLFFEAVAQFRSFFPYILVGVAIGALCHGFVPDRLVYELAGPHNPLAVPVSAVIGVPLYVRASTMVPIGMSLLGKGMSMGAVMALIIGGAGASLPEMVMLKRLFRWPLLAAFLCTVIGMAVSAGLVMNGLH